MKMNQYNQIEVIDGKLTLDGVTAPMENWELIGIKRANWMGIEKENQPACVPDNAWQKIRELLARAKDMLPDATADRVIGRAVTLAAADRDTVAVTQAMHALSRFSVNVPSNINVWSHTKGTSAMIEAAKTLSEAAKTIAEKAAH